MNLLQKEIHLRSETIQSIAYHMYTASHRIPSAAESALNEAMAILLVENEECRKMQEKEGQREMLVTAVEGLCKHPGVNIGKPISARLLVDEDVDKWDAYREIGKAMTKKIEECVDRSVKNVLHEEIHDRVNKTFGRMAISVEITDTNSQSVIRDND